MCIWCNGALRLSTAFLRAFHRQDKSRDIHPEIPVPGMTARLNLSKTLSTRKGSLNRGRG